MEKQILVVDDRFEDIEAAKKILENAGYSVRTATNGAQAFDIINADGIDLILVDVMMPTLSGYDLLRLLRSKYNGRIKIIYFSIVPKDEVDMDGADGFIQKPFSEKTLLDGLKKVFTKSK